MDGKFPVRPQGFGFSCLNSSIMGSRSQKYSLLNIEKINSFNLRDADEIENWMLEKLQLAEEKIEIDNIQSKHKKHQAFEAELGIIKHASRNNSYHS